MSLLKSRYRIVGTVVGAAVGTVLVVQFAEIPGFFVLALAAWLGCCTALATGLRNFRAYGAVLAGYTTVIVAMDAVSEPSKVFHIASARVIYICLGIVTEALFSSLFASDDPYAEIRSRLATFLTKATQASGRSMRGELEPEAVPRLFSDALDLDVMAEYAAAASGIVRRRLSHLRIATLAALAQMSTAHVLRDYHFSPDQIQLAPLLCEVAELLDDPTCDVTKISALKSCVQTELLLEHHSLTKVISTRLVLLDRLEALLAALEQAAASKALFGSSAVPAPHPRVVFHFDWIGAVHNAIRSFSAILAGSVLWLGTAWTSGPGFISILSVVCAIFTARNNRIASGIGFLKGAIAAILAGAVYNFVILPHATGFWSFATAITPIMFATGLALQRPKLSAPATSFAFLFLDLVISANLAEHAIFFTFLRSAVTLLLGGICAVLAFALVFPNDPQAERARICLAVRRDLAHIGRAPRRWSIDAWLILTADRLGRQLTIHGANSFDQIEQDLRDILAALAIGQAAISLFSLHERHRLLRRSLSCVRRRLASGSPVHLSRTARLAARQILNRLDAVPPAVRGDFIKSAILLHQISRIVDAHAMFLEAVPRSKFENVCGITRQFVSRRRMYLRRSFDRIE